ncbi:MAG: hypothetical protein LBU47_01870 [Christensenellaceae bacterium]|jgi:hypothetical protein|nr:hypothetical protein [Christensenellaceae bacterium]
MKDRPLTREYVREIEKFYFRMTRESIENAEANLRRDNKRITALAAASAVAGMAGLIFAILIYLK